MRKALSLVLVLALVLGSFSMAFAATPAGLSDIAGNANADAIQVAYDLGIVTGNPDGTYLPAKAVNRAEFAALITRALAVPDSALAGYTATKFKDTAGYDWAVKYLAFAETKGIMLGDGQGNVMPGRTITVNEAMTMALRAIGYTSNSDALVGAWPANYVTLAQNEGLYDKVAAALTVDKANAAQIIYNILTVDKVSVNSEGTTTVKADVNLLNTGLNCDTDDNYTITGADFDNTVMNINGYIGAHGTAYMNDDEEIVAFTVDSKALTGDMDGDKFEADGVDYTLPTGFTSAPAIKNAGTSATVTLADMLTYADSGKVTLNVELSGKTIKQVYSIVGWQATAADVVASSDLDDIADDETLLTEEFVTDEDGKIDTAQFTLTGAASVDKIAKDDVVFVYADSNNDIRKIEVGTAVVTGKVAEKGSDYVIVNGAKYKATSFASLADKTLPTLGDNVEMKLDVNGKIFDFEDADAATTTDKYALVNVYEHNNGTLDNSRIKLYTSADATKIYAFADENSEIDWMTSTSIDVTSKTAMDAALAAGKLVGYDVDASGAVDTINLQATTATVQALSTKVLKSGSTYYDIASDVVVFSINGTDYDIKTIAEVTKNTDLVGAQFILNDDDDDDVAALAIASTGFSVDDSDVYGVINSFTSVINSDDDTVQKLVGFIGKTTFTKNTDGSPTIAAAPIVELYKFTVDANDVVTNAVTMGAVVNGTSSGYVVKSALVTDLNGDNTVLTVSGGAMYTVAADAVVYEVVMDGDEVDSIKIGSLNDLQEDFTVSLYDTKGDDANGIANVVFYVAD